MAALSKAMALSRAVSWLQVANITANSNTSKVADNAPHSPKCSQLRQG